MGENKRNGRALKRIYFSVTEREYEILKELARLVGGGTLQRFMRLAIQEYISRYSEILRKYNVNAYNTLISNVNHALNELISSYNRSFSERVSKVSQTIENANMSVSEANKDAFIVANKDDDDLVIKKILEKQNIHIDTDEEFLEYVNSDSIYDL